MIDKLGSLGVSSTNVVLRVNKNPIEEKHAQTTKKNSQIAECTVVLKGGMIIHTSDRSEDMYASIDLVAHKVPIDIFCDLFVKWHLIAFVLLSILSQMATRLKRVTEKVQSKKRSEKVRNQCLTSRY